MPNLTPDAPGLTPAEPPSLVPGGGGAPTPSDPPSLVPSLPAPVPDAPPDLTPSIPPQVPPGAQWASQPQAEAGASASTLMSPLRTSQATIDNLIRSGAMIIPKGLSVGGNNTTALQDAFNRAEDNGLHVFIPPGNYPSHPLTKSQAVMLLGANRLTTTITALSDGVLITSTGTVPLTVPNLPNAGHAGIFEITLDGNGIGTTGLKISETQFWSVDGVISKGFTDAGFDFVGAVGGYCTDCRAFSNGTGYRFKDAYPSTTFGPGNHLPSNLVGLERSVAHLNNYRGIDYQGGCNFSVERCQIESNGSAGNSNSGGIYVKAVHHTPGSHGLIMKGGWIEDSRGGYHIHIDEADGATLHEIDAVLMYNYSDTLEHAVVINGTKPNHVVLKNCRVDNNSIRRDIYVSGTNDRAVIELQSGSNFDVLNSARGPIRTPVFPRAWWRMNEGTGSTTLDAAAEELDGSLSNTSWVTGRRTGTSALSFNGTSSNLQSPLSKLLNIPDKRVSLSVWVKVASAPGAASVTISTGSAELVYITALVINTGGTAQFSLYNGALNPEAVGSVNVSDNQWHHICGTYDGKVSRLYVDGVLDAEIEASLDILAVSSPKVICGMTVNSTLKLTGSLEDARFYNMCLSPSDVANIAV